MKMQTSKDLVAAFPTEDHFDTHRLDLAAEQVHRRARPDRGHVKGLEMVNDIGYRIEALLHGEDVFMMYGPKEMCRFARRKKIRGVFETN